MIIIYNMIRFILYIIILLVSLFSKKKRDFFIRRFNNKMITDLSSAKILIHMSSVGELNLSEELINQLLLKGERIIISIMTDTGMSLATNKYSTNHNVEIIYFPLDDYRLLKNLFSKNKIKKVIVIETEIWPNLFYLSNKYSTLYMVNARLTDKNLKKYMKIKWIIKSILKFPKYIMVQSREDMERYISILGKTDKIVLFNNLKYTVKYKTLTTQEKQLYYDNWIFEDRKVIVCGSIRDGEESLWIEAFNSINHTKEWQLILVPRHLERVKDMKQKSGANSALFSENIKAEIIIVDKMGVLRDLYQLSAIAFVGGTLVDIGGHSILEPLFYNNKPVIGKYYNNIKDIVEELRKIDMVSIVETKEDIINAVMKNDKIDSNNFFKSHNDLNKIIEILYK